MSHPAPAAAAAAGAAAPLPPTIARVLDRFRALGREEKMQALVGFSKKLEPVPARYADADRAQYTVPECQTRVDLFPEVAADGTLRFYADVNVRQSPTIAAVLAITFQAVNGQPPAVTLAIPPDYVRQLMSGIGLAAREVGLNAMVERLKRHAREAQTATGDTATGDTAADGTTAGAAAGT
jgi:cysteine desulfuration protein SufE